MKKFMKAFLKVLGKILLIGLIGFVATFTLYITNGENKLIYYVVRPFLNKHYDSQVRDRRIWFPFRRGAPQNARPGRSFSRSSRFSFRTVLLFCRQPSAAP